LPPPLLFFSLPFTGSGASGSIRGIDNHLTASLPIPTPHIACRSLSFLPTCLFPNEIFSRLAGGFALRAICKSVYGSEGPPSFFLMSMVISRGQRDPSNIACLRILFGLFSLCLRTARVTDPIPDRAMVGHALGGRFTKGL